MDLLFRGEKFPNECFGDYLDRLGCWNGFSSGISFRRTLKKYYNDNYGQEDEKLESIYQYVYALERILIRNISLAELQHDTVNDSYVDNVLKICPECWSENGYIRSYWHVRAYCICHIHKTKMQIVDSIPYMGGPYESVSMEENSDEKNKYINLIIEKFCEVSNSASFINCEIEKCNYEQVVILWIGEFCENNLKIYLKYKKVLSKCIAGLFVGKDIYLSMEEIIDMLVDDTRVHRDDIEALIVIRIKNNRKNATKRYYACPPDGFIEWAEKKLLSNNGLFRLLNKIDDTKGYHRQLVIKEELKCLENLSESDDYQIFLVVCSLRGLHRSLFDSYGDLYRLIIIHTTKLYYPY